MPKAPTPAPHVADFLARANSKKGDKYVFAAKGPDEFDCSGLIIWDLGGLGYSGLPGDSDGLLAWCQAEKTTIPLAQAYVTAGAMVFRRGKGKNGHVVISLGNGLTIEAKGTAYGVGNFAIKGRDFTDAGLVPGMIYGAAGALAVGSSSAPSSSGGGGIGADLGELTKAFEALADPHLWQRVGLVAGGTLLVAVGAGIVKGDVWGYVPLVGGS